MDEIGVMFQNMYMLDRKWNKCESNLYYELKGIRYIKEFRGQYIYQVVYQVIKRRGKILQDNYDI